MAKEIIVNPGEIFCIPLFMSKDDWKLKEKLSDKDLDKDFAFGRVIEHKGSVLVEIFNKIAPATTDFKEIEASGVMFSPIKIFWIGVTKKRWRVIGKTENYNPYEHSNYENLYMALGSDGDFRLRHFATETEVPITRGEIIEKEYPFAVVWFPIDLENRILEKIGNQNK